MTPLLMMPPRTVAPNALMPLNAEIAPWLATWMPPETMPPLTRMPFAPKFVATILPLSTIAPLMVLWARTPMPFVAPEIRLVLMNPPLRKVLLVIVTPFGPMVPALVTPPVKVAALITIAVV
jgi:hypothetical protein